MPINKATLTTAEPEEVISKIEKWEKRLVERHLAQVLGSDIVSETPGETTVNLIKHALSLDVADGSKGKIYALLIMHAIKKSSIGPLNEDEIFWASINDYQSKEPRNDATIIKIRNPRLVKADSRTQDVLRKSLLTLEDLDALMGGNVVTKDSRAAMNPRRIKSIEALDAFFGEVLNTLPQSEPDITS